MTTTHRATLYDVCAHVLCCMSAGTLVGLLLGFGLDVVNQTAIQGPRLALWGFSLGALAGVIISLYHRVRNRERPDD